MNHTSLNRTAIRVVAAVGAIVCFSVLAGGLGASPAESGEEAPGNSARPAGGGLGDPGKLTTLSWVGKVLKVLDGADARRQLSVTAHFTSGQKRDVTTRVDYETEPEGIVNVAPDGLVTPLANGTVKVTARLLQATEWTLASGARSETSIELRVARFDEHIPVNFPNQVVPIFTKNGCNGGGCHGKSGGQNGFRLSLLGFYPREDYEFLVKESRGRRVSVASPDRSLLLLKATNAVPHGGGQRLAPESHEYRLIHRWMRQGMPYGSDSDPKVTRIEVFPAERTLDRHSRQQLVVLAHYSDGKTEDVSRVAQFESNDTETAEVDEQGVVSTLGLTGDVAVMVRFQGQVGVFRATVPLGVELKDEDLPPVRNFVDTFVFNKLKALGLPPSKVCDDATFIRRVTVDIAGRLPTKAEVEAFSSSADRKKREQLIDRLLDSTDYADYFANKWAAVLRNKRRNGSYTRGTYAFHRWIRDSLHRNVSYDRFVKGIVAASGEINRHPPVAWYRAVATPEQQVEDTAQLFLGLRIQCARCHHHPFEKWSQRDYYGFQAFFTRVGHKRGNNGLSTNVEPAVFHRYGKAAAKNPRTQENLPPTGLGDKDLDIEPHEDPRVILADWMANPENPFFARALVNRYWKHFFGRGIVEPEDDMRVTNPPSNPELLDGLAKHFIAGGFDLKDLVRTICRSTTYQLSALPNEYNAGDRQNYSRYYPKRLNAEVLYDALHQVTGTPVNFGGLPAGTRAVQLPDTGVNNYFLTVFGRPMADSACECERSSEANLAQSLHLLNSKEVLGKISHAKGRAAKLAAANKRTIAEKIAELYTWAFARLPDDEEVAIAKRHIEKTKNKKEAYEDIVWALINTKEFLFNH